MLKILDTFEQTFKAGENEMGKDHSVNKELSLTEELRRRSFCRLNPEPRSEPLERTGRNSSPFQEEKINKDVWIATVYIYRSRYWRIKMEIIFVHPAPSTPADGLLTCGTEDGR